MTTFHIEIVKPSHYDKDGYVIQWWKAWIPSNSMAALYGIAQNCADRAGPRRGCRHRGRRLRRDECRVIPIEQIASRIKQPGHSGLVCIGRRPVQSVPARDGRSRANFAPEGWPSAIGGFHVSGCLAMLKEPTPEGLKEAIALGILLYAGEAEEHFALFLQDVHQGVAEKSRSPTPWTICRTSRGRRIPYLPRRLVSRYGRRAVVVRRRPGLPVPVLLLHDHQRAGTQVALPQRRRHRAHRAGRMRRRRSGRASSSPTTISPATRTGRRSSTD